MNFREAWAALWCGGRVLLAESHPLTVADNAAGGADAKPALPRAVLVLECGRGKPETCRCPRAKTFRQLAQQVQVHKLLVADRDGYVVDSHLEGAAVHDFDHPAVVPEGIQPAPGADLHADPIPPQRVDGIDHAQYRPDHGQAKGSPLLPGCHAPHSASAATGGQGR